MQWGLDRKRTYDTVDDSAATVKEIIELLTAGGYLEISEGRYPLVGLGPRCREAATDEFRLYMKRKPRPIKARTGLGANASSSASINDSIPNTTSLILCDAGLLLMTNSPYSDLFSIGIPSTKSAYTKYLFDVRPISSKG